MSNNNAPIIPNLTVYSPQTNTAKDPMQGGVSSARAGPGQNKRDWKTWKVNTLMDYATGKSNYVTIAGNPALYGKTYVIPEITFVDSSNKTRTLKNVPVYVHDTGSAFKNAPEGRFDIPIEKDANRKLINANHALFKNVQLIPSSPDIINSSQTRTVQQNHQNQTGQSPSDTGQPASRSLGQPPSANQGQSSQKYEYNVIGKTRDQLSADQRKSVPGKRIVSLDFNSAGKAKGKIARGAEIIIPNDATPEERRAAEQYLQDVKKFFEDRGYKNYPIRGVFTTDENKRRRPDGKGGISGFFHTEAFFEGDQQAVNIVEKYKEDFARVHSNSLGKIAGVTFIAAHEQKATGAVYKTADGKPVSETAYGMGMVSLLQQIKTSEQPSAPNEQQLASIPKELQESMKILSGQTGISVDELYNVIDTSSKKYGVSTSEMVQKYASKELDITSTTGISPVKTSEDGSQTQAGTPGQQQTQTTNQQKSTDSNVSEGEKKFGYRGRGSPKGVDPRLMDLFQKTANDFPLRVRFMSGKVGRRAGAHSRGLAGDITIYDTAGNALPNYQNSQTFRIYEMFAQKMRENAKTMYPELADDNWKNGELDWGGLFGGANNNPDRYKYGSLDSMDYRINFSDNTNAGSIIGGLNQRYKGKYDAGDIFGGSKPYDADVLANDIKKLTGFALTKEQYEKIKKEGFFGVAQASGSLPDLTQAQTTTDITAAAQPAPAQPAAPVSAAQPAAAQPVPVPVTRAVATTQVVADQKQDKNKALQISKAAAEGVLSKYKLDPDAPFDDRLSYVLKTTTNDADKQVLLNYLNDKQRTSPVLSSDDEDAAQAVAPAAAQPAPAQSTPVPSQPAANDVIWNIPGVTNVPTLRLESLAKSRSTRRAAAINELNRRRNTASSGAEDAAFAASPVTSMNLAQDAAFASPVTSMNLDQDASFAAQPAPAQPAAQPAPAQPAPAQPAPQPAPAQPAAPAVIPQDGPGTTAQVGQQVLTAPPPPPTVAGPGGEMAGGPEATQFTPEQIEETKKAAADRDIRQNLAQRAATATGDTGDGGGAAGSGGGASNSADHQPASSGSTGQSASDESLCWV